MRNKKLEGAIWVLSWLPMLDPRLQINKGIEHGDVSAEDPWVIAALNCKDDANIPEIAYEFFLADVMDGRYVMHNVEPLAAP